MTDPVASSIGRPAVGSSGVERGNGERETLERAAEHFESLFVQIWVRRMRDAQLSEGFFGSGPGSSVYEGMFEQYLAEQIGRSSPLGIKEMLLRSWTGGGPGDAPDPRELERRVRALQARDRYDHWIHEGRIGLQSGDFSTESAPADPGGARSSSGSSDR